MGNTVITQEQYIINLFYGTVGTYKADAGGVTVTIKGEEHRFANPPDADHWLNRHIGVFYLSLDPKRRVSE